MSEQSDEFKRGLNAAAAWHEKQADRWRAREFVSLNDLEQSANDAGREALARVHESYAAVFRGMGDTPEDHEDALD